MEKPPLTFRQIWNMNFGFFGIQFGWGLQMANMSAIYEYLGARPDQIPLLWLAAPLTGLIVQPVIGHMSDHTWGRLGRRRPYFLAGAILSSLALVAMPNCSALWMAAGLLWVLDASINTSMGPFRAFVTDLLPESQRTQGFAMQSLIIGLGAVIASALPWLLARGGIAQTASGAIPPTVRLSFYVGAAVFLIAVLWTVFTTREYPPEYAESSERGGLARSPREIITNIVEMPRIMRHLAAVQLCTWLGLYCMWLYFPVAVAHNVFGARDAASPLYTAGVAWGGVCFAFYSAVCFVFSMALPAIARAWGRSRTHALCLLAGALGLISVAAIHSQYLLLLSMMGVGVAWASTLAMPYAILAPSLPPDKTGVYMGIFNLFIVIPEIIASLAFGWIMQTVLGNDRMAAVVAGGVFLVLAALLLRRVQESDAPDVAHRKSMVEI
jgi:maltose/moltooligosaccharide transporter